MIIPALKSVKKTPTHCVKTFLLDFSNICVCSRVVVVSITQVILKSP